MVGNPFFAMGSQSALETLRKAPSCNDTFDPRSATARTYNGQRVIGVAIGSRDHPAGHLLHARGDYCPL